MANKNIIILGYSNEVQIVSSLDLALYNEIVMTIGAESYSTVSNPTNLLLIDGVLVLDIGEITTLPIGTYIPRIVGDTELITCEEYKQIQPIQIVTC